MTNFNDYNETLEMFKQVDCVGERENWIFGGFIDRSKSSVITTSTIGRYTFGVAGQMVGQAIGKEMDSKISKVNNYFALLFNCTENGIGIIPLAGSALSLNPKKLEPSYDDYTFYNYEEISDIIVKDFWGIRKDVKRVTIKLADNKKLFFIIHMVEKNIPYQKENMTKFVKKYQK